MNNNPTYGALRIREVLFVGSNDELYPMFSGHQPCPPKHDVKTIRDYYLLCCVQSGYGSFSVSASRDGSRWDEYRMGPGETFLIAPGKLVHYISDEYEPWTYAWIAFSGRSAGKYLGYTDFADKPVIHTGSGLYEKIRDLMETAALQESPELRYVIASSVLWSILADLMEVSDRGKHTGSMNNYVETAIGIIRRRYDTILNVSDIASEIGISREYFYTLFKKDTGKSPSRYLLDFRIEKACAMLHESDYPVYLIAQHTGNTAAGSGKMRVRDERRSV